VIKLKLRRLEVCAISRGMVRWEAKGYSNRPATTGFMVLVWTNMLKWS
jgi:hypothetical protein